MPFCHLLGLWQDQGGCVRHLRAAASAQLPFPVGPQPVGYRVPAWERVQGPVTVTWWALARDRLALPVEAAPSDPHLPRSLWLRLRCVWVLSGAQQAPGPSPVLQGAGISHAK